MAIKRAGAELVIGKLKRPNRLDQLRWHWVKRNGMAVEEIAQRHDTTPLAVQNSIARVEAYHAFISNEQVDWKINSIVLNRLDEVDRALRSALTAEIVVARECDNGKTKVVSRIPDHAIRLEAAAAVRKMADRYISKSAGVQVNVQQNNACESSGKLSFESILRERRRLCGLSNGDEVQNSEVKTIGKSKLSLQTAEMNDAAPNCIVRGRGQGAGSRRMVSESSSTRPSEERSAESRSCDYLGDQGGGPNRSHV